MSADLNYFLTVLLSGTVPTVELTVFGIALCILTAFPLGIALTRQSAIVRFLARVYVEAWRGTSEVVQLFWIYFAVPVLTGFQFVPFWAGVLVLGLNSGSYGAEVVRGALRSVDKAQHEACTALNFTRTHRITRIIGPQAIPEMIPPFNNLFIQLLKATALVSLINVTEITYQGREVLEPNYPNKTLVIFMMMLILYLTLSILITLAMRALERVAARMMGKGAQRARPRNAPRMLSSTRGAR